MINYSHGYFNFPTLFRFYGSALYKACVCAALSSGIYVALYWYYFMHIPDPGEFLVHPYPVAAVVGSITIALSFKLTFSYNRWWEACTALHNMHAKWLDVGSTMAAFHLQSEMYDTIAPPSFGDHQDINFDFVHRREITEKPSSVATNETQHSNDSKSSSGKNKLAKILRWKNNDKSKGIHDSTSSGLPLPNDFWTRSKSYEADGTSKSPKKQKVDPTVKPSLFLQETAHLVSLLSAVSLSSLRYDAEGEEAPLTEFVPRKKWPSTNSDNDQEMRQNGYRRNKIWSTVKFMLDASRSREEVLEYNSARPFHVIGGISDKEAESLRKAKGASAKVALVYMWINEFIIREHHHGSMGKVAAPIISRLMQFTSDGHLWYNAARKMAYIPFPFPHVQLITAYVFGTITVVPLLMLSKSNVYFGFVLNFLTVTILVGLNEVAKELELPYNNVPNDLPLNLFQAHFNESLITMFAGYHPDSYWDVQMTA